MWLHFIKAAAVKALIANKTSECHVLLCRVNQVHDWTVHNGSRMMKQYRKAWVLMRCAEARINTSGRSVEVVEVTVHARLARRATNMHNMLSGTQHPGTPCS